MRVRIRTNDVPTSGEALDAGSLFGYPLSDRDGSSLCPMWTFHRGIRAAAASVEAHLNPLERHQPFLDRPIHDRQEGFDLLQTVHDLDYDRQILGQAQDFRRMQ